MIHFIIDEDKKMECTFGEYNSYDDSIILNLAMIDDPREVMVTIDHEFLHKLIEESGEPTTEEQDHYIIPRLLC